MLCLCKKNLSTSVQNLHMVTQSLLRWWWWWRHRMSHAALPIQLLDFSHKDTDQLSSCHDFSLFRGRTASLVKLHLCPMLLFRVHCIAINVMKNKWELQEITFYTRPCGSFASFSFQISWKCPKFPNVLIEKNLSISGAMQFKLVLFKGKLCFHFIT